MLCAGRTILIKPLEQTVDAEVLAGTHTHPVWGRARISDYITKNRDVYRYTHDQTVRHECGYTPKEITDMIKLPPSLESYFGCRVTTVTCVTTSRRCINSIWDFMTSGQSGPAAAVGSGRSRYLDLAGGAVKLSMRLRRHLTRGIIAGRLNC